jgi:hypothetical protein
MIMMLELLILVQLYNLCFCSGKEIVSGSYDKTVRIFRTDMGRSREVYHTKRMQRLSSVIWSSDNRVRKPTLRIQTFICPKLGPTPDPAL